MKQKTKINKGQSLDLFFLVTDAALEDATITFERFST